MIEEEKLSVIKLFLLISRLCKRIPHDGVTEAIGVNEDDEFPFVPSCPICELHDACCCSVLRAQKQLRSTGD